MRQETSYMVHLGNNVARLRGFRRIPQKEMAAKLGLTQQEYSRIENKDIIEDDLLEQIAKAIDFPTELIKELENSAIQNIHNSGSITDSIFYQNNPIEKLEEIYERLLKSEREKNEILNNTLTKLLQSK